MTGTPHGLPGGLRTAGAVTCKPRIKSWFPQAPTASLRTKENAGTAEKSLPINPHRLNMRADRCLRVHASGGRCVYGIRQVGPAITVRRIVLIADYPRITGRRTLSGMALRT